MATSTSNNAAGTGESSISDGNLLVLVVDVNPDQRAFLSKPARRLTKWLDSGLALVNSHLLLHPSNEVAVVAASKRSCKFLYPDDPGHSSQALEETGPHSVMDGQFEGFRRIENIIRKRAQGMIVGEILQAEEPGQPLFTPDSLIAGGLCMALSYINRRHKDSEMPTVSANSDKSENASTKESKSNPTDVRARILVMTASGSTATQYMNYMNAFFTAQVNKNTYELKCSADYTIYSFQ